ncbi:MlaD family protein [Chryseolinea lacunae]|uniref:MCE family protein n=1 Tax=Chryseolinea lacunae TaxID=2801331 RepID=A0ABS1KU72_9BACT|nr:MlaD family protein [Chryseolinea lacunae]MBL0743028.1 MCE family protein [Chryseolinea lacunae]
MRNKRAENTKVGMLVVAGLAFLILLLYMIGKNRNLLGSTFTITAVVTNVNGLVAGNNVRFKGMDVGTVKSITVTNDSDIFIVMTIDEKMKAYIKQNALASIGTDGLMGNKLVNINSVAGTAPPVIEGSILQSRPPVETDEMLRTLNTTNTNIEKISKNLYEITAKLNTNENLWKLLSDTAITHDLKKAVAGFRDAGHNTADLTATTKRLALKLEQGDGLANRLFTDTTLSNQLAASLQQMQAASNKTADMMSNLKTIVDHMENGEGSAGLLLRDTVFRKSLMNSAVNLEQGIGRFNQNMEALKTNFLFRKYFKKLEKEQAEDARQNKK